MSSTPSNMAASPTRISTMGMFIIDTFQFLDAATGEDLGNEGLQDQIGGGGCYFAIGARVWLPPSDLQMIIDRGCDWKPQHQLVLDQFNRTPLSAASDRNASMWHYRSRIDRTTRAVNVYRGQYRGFEYLSPKIRLEPSDLMQCCPTTPPMLPEWIHLICSPERAFETISQIDAILTQSIQAPARFPNLVYEPIPDSCIFDNLSDCLRVLPRLAVFSPNHEEAVQILGLQHEWERVLEQDSSEQQASGMAVVDFVTTKLAGGFTHHLESQQDGLIQRGMPFGPIICIRSGAWGSVVGRAGLGFHHVPAWHTPPTASSKDEQKHLHQTGHGDQTSSSTCMLETSSGRIKDVTGAGNSFLGGFTAHLAKTQSDAALDSIERMKQAAMHGAVSASLVIEQLGLPCFEVDDGREVWNGHTAAERLDTLRARLSSLS